MPCRGVAIPALPSPALLSPALLSPALLSPTVEAGGRAVSLTASASSRPGVSMSVTVKPSLERANTCGRVMSLCSAATFAARSFRSELAVEDLPTPPLPGARARGTHESEAPPALSCPHGVRARRATSGQAHASLNRKACTHAGTSECFQAPIRPALARWRCAASLEASVAALHRGAWAPTLRLATARARTRHARPMRRLGQARAAPSRRTVSELLPWSRSFCMSSYTASRDGACAPEQQRHSRQGFPASSPAVPDPPGSLYVWHQGSQVAVRIVQALRSGAAQQASPHPLRERPPRALGWG